MRRLSNLYDNMISYRNIVFVYNRIRSKCHNKNKIMRFDRYKNCHLIDILERLKSGTYSFSNYHIFLIHEKKYRIIMSENIFDKIVNQMISYYILLPSMNCLIDSNIATRKNKGSGYGYKLFEKYINSINGDIYVLRIDISKYFYNIDHDILFSMLEKRIKDKKALFILKRIISLTDDDYVNRSISYLINKEIKRVNNLNISVNEKKRLTDELNSIPLYKKGKGLSIGCLSNQLMAVFYLNDLDHYIKEVLGCKYYIRYMDDIYILGSDYDYLKRCFGSIRDELREIKLDVNKKSGIYRLKEGVSFLGYTYTNGFIRYDSNTIRKINRKIKYLYNNDFDLFFRSISSYKGYFIRCNTSLFFSRYNDLCMNSRYDKYLVIKKRYSNYLVFIKYRNRYYTYGNDLYYVNKRFGTNYRWFKRSVVYSFDNVIILMDNSIVARK